MKICDFVKAELEYIISAANFTEEEKQLFLLRAKDMSLEKCAEEMNLSISAVKAKSQKINNKIKRVLFIDF